MERLLRGEVPPEDLLLARRVSRGPEGWRAATLTHAAVLRARDHGVDVHPGTKVRFVVIDEEGSGRERVRLAEELCDGNLRPDLEYYRMLAIRAMWTVLAPFGWTEAELAWAMVLQPIYWISAWISGFEEATLLEQAEAIERDQAIRCWRGKPNRGGRWRRMTSELLRPAPS